MSEADQELYDALRRIAAKYPLPEVKWTGQLEMTQRRVQQNLEGVLPVRPSLLEAQARLEVLKARAMREGRHLIVSYELMTIDEADNQPDK